MKYIITKEVSGFTYYLADSKKEIPFWTGIRDNAKTFDSEKQAEDWMYSKSFSGIVNPLK